ncbi:unnamed protein product [Laminaria digitata]
MMMKPSSTTKRNSCSSSSSRRRNSCTKSAAILSTASLSLGICAASLAPLAADCSPSSALANDASLCRGVLSQQRQQRALRAAQSAAQTETLCGFENPSFERQRQQQQQQQQQKSSTSGPSSDDVQAPAAEEEGGRLDAHYKYPWCDSESDPDCYSAGSGSSGDGGGRGVCGEEYDPEESDADFSQCSSGSNSGSNSGSDSGNDSGSYSGSTCARGSHSLGLGGGGRAAKNFADFGRSYRHPFYPGPCSGNGSSSGSGNSGSGGSGSRSGSSGSNHYQQRHHEHENEHQLQHQHHQQSGHPLQHHQNHHQHHQQHQLRSSSVSVPSSSPSIIPFFPPLPAGVRVGAGVEVVAKATAAAGIALAIVAPLFQALSSHWAFFVAGGICAAVSHTAAVPLDVLKTRIQCASPEEEYRGTWDALVRICRSEGTQALFCGAGATLVGYTMQGSLKFGFFEFLKPIFSRLFSGSGGGGAISSAISAPSSSVLGPLVAASIAAELVGSTALTPLEAARIRMVADRHFATGVRSGIARIVSEEGLGALGRGLPAVLAKQLPYTVTKLVTFDVFRRAVTKAMRSRTGGKTVLGAGGGGGGPLVGQAWITVGCAVAAGMLSSLASQPGDSLLSILHSEGRRKQRGNSGGSGGGGGGGGSGRRGTGGSNGNVSSEDENVDGGTCDESFDGNLSEAFEEDFPECFEEERDVDVFFADREPVIHALVRIAREVGFRGLFRGTTARMLHVTFIVTLQLLIYQSVKRMVGIAT